ncbi:MAG: tetratricopeptide repeat protein [Pseudomonadota bacterium]
MTNWDDLYDRIIDHGPSSETLFVVLSGMKESGQLKRAVQECIRALAIFPDDIPIRQLLAKTYFEMGLLSQAEAEVEKVISRFDDLCDAYKLQANIYYRQKRNQESADALRIYLAHRRDDEDALQLLETLGATQETHAPKPAAVEEVPPEFLKATGEEAGPQIETAGEGSPISNGEAFPEIATPTLAEIYFSQGQIPEAINTYEMVVAQNPEDEQSRQRINELKTMVSAKPAMEAQKRDREREIKERMIAVLEAWLAGIRKMSRNDSLPL